MSKIPITGSIELLFKGISAPLGREDGSQRAKKKGKWQEEENKTI